MVITRSDLFIDRLCLTFKIIFSERPGLDRSLEEMVNDEVIMRVTNPFSKLLKSYRRAYVVQLAENSQFSIQVEPRDAQESTALIPLNRRGGRRYLRIEWNPHSAAMQAGHTVDRVVGLMRDIIPNFNYETLLEANITRMDLTVDLRGLPLDRIDVFTLLRRTNAETYKYQYGPNGKLNSVRLGLYEADKLLLVYDKLFEQKNLQIGRLTRRNPITGRPIILRRLPHTRFELRLRDIGTFTSMGAMTNPFTSYTVRTLHGHDVPGDILWQYFLDSCRWRGIQGALSLARDRAQRDKLRRRVQMLEPPPWWNPEALWRELPAAIAHVFGTSLSGSLLPSDPVIAL